MREGVVGRGDELDASAELLTRLKHGSAALVYSGPAGIGKTTVLTEAVARAQSSAMAVLHAAPAETESELAFSALSDLLEPVVDELLSELAEPQGRALAIAMLRRDPGPLRLDQRAVASGVLSMMRLLVGRGPLLLAIDDLHWCDRASARVLAFAIRRLNRAPVGLLACHRTGDCAELPLELRTVFPDERLLRIPLGPLDLAELHQLLEERLGRSFPYRTLVRIAHTAGGNPFFALEIGRWLPDDLLPGRFSLSIPTSLSQLIERRIVGFSAATRMALLAAAASPAPTIALVSAATGQSALSSRRALEPAAEAGIIDLDDHVRFAHPLYGAVVYSSASRRRRHDIHQRLARLTDEIEEKARHTALGAPAADASSASLSETAAEHARRRGAPEVAAELAEHARLLTPSHDIAHMLRRSIQAAEYRFHSGDLSQARSLLEQQLPHAVGGQRGEVLRLLGEIRAQQGDMSEAICLLQEALGHVGRAPDIGSTIELHLAFWSVLVGDFSSVEAHAHQALVLSQQYGAPALLAEALAMLTFVNFLLGRGLDRAAMQRALELEDVHRNVSVEMRPSLLAGILDIFTGRLRDAIARLSRLRERVLESGDDSELAFVSGHLAWAECWRGDLGAAATYSAEAVETAARICSDTLLCRALALGAIASAYQGDVVGTRDRAERTVALAARTGLVISLLWAKWAVGVLELSGDNPQGVDCALGPLAARVEETGLEEPVRAMFLADEIEALIALGQHVRAERLTSLLEQAGARQERGWALAAAARCRALLHASHGDLDGAAQAAADAIAIGEGLELRLEFARTLLVAGGIARRRRRKRAAISLLTRSMQLFQEGGAVRWMDKARRECDRAGLQRGATEVLTVAEQRVAELTATGLTNRQVAAALFMSPKTVEATLARIYAKLGINSRAQLGARFGDARRSPSAD